MKIGDTVMMSFDCKIVDYKEDINMFILKNAHTPSSQSLNLPGAYFGIYTEYEYPDISRKAFRWKEYLVHEIHEKQGYVYYINKEYKESGVYYLVPAEEFYFYKKNPKEFMLSESLIMRSVDLVAKPNKKGHELKGKIVAKEEIQGVIRAIHVHDLTGKFIKSLDELDYYTPDIKEFDELISNVITLVISSKTSLLFINAHKMKESS